jgi:hypothetical protein
MDAHIPEGTSGVKSRIELRSGDATSNAVTLDLLAGSSLLQ